MRLVLLRHGETDWNLEKRIQGTKDVPINRNGMRQVQETCNLVFKRKEFGFSLIATSPLLRTLQSARICSRILRIPIRVFPYFQERSFGMLEGKKVDEIRELYGIEDVEQIKESLCGIEDASSFYDRINRGLSELSRNHRNEKILLVTHGSVIKLIGEQYGSETGIIPNGSFMKYHVVTGHS